MTANWLLLPILIPVIAGVSVFFVPDKIRGLKEALAILATLATAIITFLMFGKEMALAMPWLSYGISFSLRLYHFSSFTIISTAFFAFLIALYSSVSLFNKTYAKFFYAYFLLAVGFVIGASLADNLILMLFFWEGLLVAMFGMISIGNKNAFKTATKTFIIVGISDLCMMVGIALCGNIAGTFEISKISMSMTGLGGLAFLLLMIGAIAKGGSMPFHSWIPDAAVDAPLPFMAILPAALEKFLSIYFLTRISMDMFTIEHSSWASYTMMIVGAVTIVFAVMMALIQKDFKRLLSYHAISQLGYMILGVGTLTPVGIVGGLFHMVNNALYKSCLFLTGGAVEKETGTTDLAKLGGIGKRMPITFACFAITALAISGVPPFNGFFSKELVYDGALERGWIFYAAAVIGSFFTAASFLKLGHAAFLGKVNKENEKVKEVSLPMLIPMVIIALVCILFGVFNAFPINKLIAPCLGANLAEGHSFAGFPSNMLLVYITIAVLVGALLNHIYGVKKTGSGLKAVDHIHYAPGLKQVYGGAEKGYFDPYNIWWVIINIFSTIANWTDKAIDWVYNDLIAGTARTASVIGKSLHNGSYRTYIVWSVAAAVLIVTFLIKSF